MLAGEQLSLERSPLYVFKRHDSLKFRYILARHVGCKLGFIHLCVLMRTTMKYQRLLLTIVFLLVNCVQLCAQTKTSQPSAKVLRNGDILRLYKAGVKPGEIIGKIVTSHCNFDTFPTVLRELKMKGLPNTVIMAMVTAPYGPPAQSLPSIASPEPSRATSRIQVPVGTIIQIEIAKPLSSADAIEGEQIKFLVSRRVLINGIEVIKRGAVANARVFKSKPAATWGRGGLLGWVLEDVAAIDGTRVPIKLTERLAGKTRSKAVVAAAIATGAVVLPYSSPVGLIWALKKGDEAILDESRKSIAVVTSNTDVAGLMPKTQKVIYHSVDKQKTTDASNVAPGLAPFNSTFKATPIRKN